MNRDSGATLPNLSITVVLGYFKHRRESVSRKIQGLLLTQIKDRRGVQVSCLLLEVFGGTTPQELSLRRSQIELKSVGPSVAYHPDLALQFVC